MSVQTSPMPRAVLEPVPHWNKLCREDEVLLFRAGEKVAAGRVDMRALDGSVFWLIQNGGMGRHMVHANDGITVFRRPQTHKAS